MHYVIHDPPCTVQAHLTIRVNCNVPQSHGHNPDNFWANVTSYVYVCVNSRFFVRQTDQRTDVQAGLLQEWRCIRVRLARRRRAVPTIHPINQSLYEHSLV